MGRVGHFFKELRRRRVFGVAALYIVAAWVGVQVADQVIEAGYLRGWSLRNAWNAAFIGFPLALIVGWFYDISRIGIVRTPPVDADESFDKSLHKRDYFLFASLAAIWAVAYVFVHTPAPLDKSIAVLPFVNAGHDPENALFAFGIRLDLQTQLEKLQDIKVIAAASVEKIDKDLPVPVMAQKLGVAFIMKGTVERVLDQVRVSVTLIDAETEQAWRESYDRKLDIGNLFDIRDEIAGTITGRLQAVLSPQELESIQTRATENFDAYWAYLLGKKRFAKRTSGALAEAVEYFQQAIELDPDFALAYVGLADSYNMQTGYSGLPRVEQLPKVEAAIDKALELDDQLGEAYATLGMVHRQKRDPAAAEVAFKRALELNPNYATAHLWYAALLSSSLDRPEEGLARIRKAQQLDPLSAVINANVAGSFFALGRFDEALAQNKKVIEIDPAYPGAYYAIALNYWAVLGQNDDAVAWFRKAIALDAGRPHGHAQLGYTYLELGDVLQAEHWINRSMELAPESWSPNFIMQFLHVYRGEEDEALVYARKVLTMNPTHVVPLRNLRNHDLQTGRYAEARTWYERSYPALLNENVPTIAAKNYQAAIDLAYVLSKTGEQERADLLLDRSLTFITTIPRLGWTGYWISDVLIYAQQGKTKEALSALRQAIDEGWRAAWWYYLEHDPNLDSIRHEPEFQAMVEEIKADMATQLERVREMEASGELEPIPDVN